MPTAAEYEENKRKTEAELRAKLGAQPDDDPTASAHAIAIPNSATLGPAGPTASTPRNPYLVALVAITCIFTVIALIAYIVSIAATDAYGLPDVGTRAAAAAVGTTWLGFAFLFFVATLVVGGITWKPPATR